MVTITKPKSGEDVRLLHRNVRKLVDGVNALSNMTAIWYGRANGHGRLSVNGGASRLYIKIEEFGKDAAGRTTPPLTLTSNANPAEVGVTIIWAAALPSNATGNVQFLVDGAGAGYRTLVNGVAYSLPVSNLLSGEHIVRVYYYGDTSYNPTSATLIQTVNELDAPTVVASGDPNPVDAGEDLIIEARVYPNQPIPPAPAIVGNVRFTIPSENYSVDRPLYTVSGAVKGANTPRIDWLDPGTYNVVATYLGSTYYGQSSDNYSQVVKASVDVTMWIDPNPVPVNSSTTLHAIVSGNHGTPTGTIQFSSENGDVGGPVSLDSGGQAQLGIGSGDTERTYAFIASYSGDSTYGPKDSDENILYVTSDFPAAFDITLPYSPYWNWFNYNQVELYDPDGYTGQIRLKPSPHAPSCAVYYNPNPVPPGGWGAYYAGPYNMGVYDQHGGRFQYLYWNSYVDVDMVDGTCVMQIAPDRPFIPDPSRGGGQYVACNEGGIYAEFEVFNPSGGNAVPVDGGTGWWFHFCNE